MINTWFAFNNSLNVPRCFQTHKHTNIVLILTATRAWNSAVGTTGMGPPCFPNFLSRLSCTDTGRQECKNELNDEWFPAKQLQEDRDRGNAAVIQR